MPWEHSPARNSPEEVERAEQAGEVPDALLAGPAEWDETLDNGMGDWDRPNQADYHIALAAEKTKR